MSSPQQPQSVVQLNTNTTAGANVGTSQLVEADGSGTQFQREDVVTTDPRDATLAGKAYVSANEAWVADDDTRVVLRQMLAELRELKLMFAVAFGIQIDEKEGEE